MMKERKEGSGWIRKKKNRELEEWRRKEKI